MVVGAARVTAPANPPARGAGNRVPSTATTYNLSFVLPGQGAQTIALTAPPSPPVTLPVREIQTSSTSPAERCRSPGGWETAR